MPELTPRTPCVRTNGISQVGPPFPYSSVKNEPSRMSKTGDVWVDSVALLVDLCRSRKKSHSWLGQRPSMHASAHAPVTLHCGSSREARLRGVL